MQDTQIKLTPLADLSRMNATVLVKKLEECAGKDDAKGYRHGKLQSHEARRKRHDWLIGNDIVCRPEYASSRNEARKKRMMASQLGKLKSHHPLSAKAGRLFLQGNADSISASLENGNTLDLHHGIPGKPCHFHGTARWERSFKERGIDCVHGGEIIHIL